MKQNYAKELSKAIGALEKDQHLNYESVFTGETETPESKALKREITKKQEEINELKRKLSNSEKPAYTCEFVPTATIPTISYQGRLGTVDFNLDGETFEREEDKVYQLVKVSTKIGQVRFVVGYVPSFGAYIEDCYAYKINASSNFATITKVSETVVPVIERASSYTLVFGESSLSSNVRTYDALMSSDEFVKSFYEDDTLQCSLELWSLRKQYINNKSTEIIIREAPSKSQRTLLNHDFKESMPMQKLLGVTTSDYNELKRLDLVDEWVDLFYGEAKLMASYYGNPFLIFENNVKTVPESIKFLEKCVNWSQFLSFYNIKIGPAQLASVLLKSYCRDKVTKDMDWWLNKVYTPNFAKYYPFGKWAEYVVSETVNQGFTSIQLFLEELKDYIDMCAMQDLKPTLYTSFLKVTHDTTARNFKIQLTPEQEETFKGRYDGFKTWVQKSGEYILIAPTSSEDVKTEASNLGSCVAFYIYQILNGETKIVFLRKANAPDDCLITVQITGNAIVRAEGVCNRAINHEEYMALSEYASERGMILAVTERG